MRPFSFKFGQSCWRPRYVYKVSFGVSAVRDNTSTSSRVHCMFYMLHVPWIHWIPQSVKFCTYCVRLRVHLSVVSVSLLLVPLAYLLISFGLVSIVLLPALYFICSTWPFSSWGLYLVSVFSLGVCQVRVSTPSPSWIFPVVFHLFVSSLYRDSSSLCVLQILGCYFEQSPDSFVLCGLWQPGQARSADAHNSPRCLFFARCDGFAGKPCLSLWCHSFGVEHEDVCLSGTGPVLVRVAVSDHNVHTKFIKD